MTTQYVTEADANVLYQHMQNSASTNYGIRYDMQYFIEYPF